MMWEIENERGEYERRWENPWGKVIWGVKICEDELPVG